MKAATVPVNFLVPGTARDHDSLHSVVIYAPIGIFIVTKDCQASNGSSVKDYIAGAFALPNNQTHLCKVE